jgi:hypothetical protein
VGCRYNSSLDYYKGRGQKERQLLLLLPFREKIVTNGTKRKKRRKAEYEEKK